MNAKELLDAGKLTDAIKALGSSLRENPSDAKGRTFLFELLCFAGEYDRAEKQLEVLGQSSPGAATGALLYRAALHAERVRQKVFEERGYTAQAAESSGIGDVTGVVNDIPFTSLVDADPRIGPRLEVFAAGAYLWIPLVHILAIEINPPRRLRDLMWATARIQTGSSFKGTELGEVLLPVLSPLSWKHPDDNVKLGRSTVWIQEGSTPAVPVGQKVLLADGEEMSFLELRQIQITPQQVD